MDEQLDRLQTIRLLKLARAKAEQRMLRIEATGEQELDKSGMDQIMKIIKMESDERKLLEAGGSATTAAAPRNKAKGPKPSE